MEWEWGWRCSVRAQDRGKEQGRVGNRVRTSMRTRARAGGVVRVVRVVREREGVKTRETKYTWVHRHAESVGLKCPQVLHDDEFFRSTSFHQQWRDERLLMNHRGSLQHLKPEFLVTCVLIEHVQVAVQFGDDEAQVELTDDAHLGEILLLENT